MNNFFFFFFFFDMSTQGERTHYEQLMHNEKGKIIPVKTFNAPLQKESSPRSHTIMWLQIKDLYSQELILFKAKSWHTER